ncbi:Gag-Pol polyprotein [Gossypium australe]|uniref:Gag-Pol polyprotein n=1 Tax=Gossypium australe TaxID=47621 RepID=A0A5B6UYL2_9ROSI|nr:Gag-Pol polyprotein [Gossypium australe]
MMSASYSKFVRANPNTPPLRITHPAPTAPQVVETIRREKPLVDKIRKQGAKEFRANIDDDLERAKFWLENTIRREFVRLSKYARECVSTKAIMCKRFEDELNENIRLLVGNLELKEFVVLIERACKDEELAKEKRKANIESHDSRKR